MKKSKNPFASLIVEMTACVGLIMLSYGLWLVEPKIMFIIIGIIFISMAVLLHRGFTKTNRGG